MAKLRTFLTQSGFFDLAVAAPSMKAAMGAWGVKQNLFHQGLAAQTADRAIVSAAMAKPGTVLRRPVGTNEPFRENADLPAGFALPLLKPAPAAKTKAKKKPPRRAEKPVSNKQHRAAILSFEKARAARDRARIKEEQTARRDAQKRGAAIEHAQAGLDAARKNHQARREAIERARDRQQTSEDSRWEKERRTLESALDRARKR